MHKKILSMILAIAMVLSMFAGIAVTASAAEGSYTLADAIAVGDTVILATADGASVFTGISNSIGQRADATPVGNVITSADAAALTVEAGTTEGTFAFKQVDGTYLGWTSGNKLYSIAAVNASSSWTVTITDGAYDIANVSDATRKLVYNASSPRFCAYTSTQTAVALYKLDESACSHEDATGEVTTAATCTEAGVLTFTCTCGTSWTEAIAALGHTWTEEITTAATCTVEGAAVATCSVCAVTEDRVIGALGHSYVDGTCSVCGEAQPATISYKLITLDSIKEGNYIIASTKKSSYDTLYAATSNISGDWYVSNTAVAATDSVITSDILPEDAQVFVLTGDNTNGFTIGFEVDGVMQYLGYSDTANNRKLALSADYATTLWTVVEASDGGFALSSAFDGGNYVVSDNSNAAGSIRGYKSGTIYAGIYLFAQVVESTCEHANVTEIPAVAATCTTAGNTAGTVCADCNEPLAGNEPIAATGHTYVYGETAITCSACDYSAEYTLSEIAAVKASTDGATYYFKGVVTYVSGKNVYIQDATAAICVYFTNADAAAGIALGDEILVWDSITTYYGLIETTYTTAQEYVKVSTGNELPLAEVTIADLLADTTNEYLGERVVIKGATVGAVDAAANTSLLDADNNVINIYKATLAENVTANDVVDATVIVSTYNGYQLLVNPGTAATDVVVVTEGEETTISTVTIAEAKAGKVGIEYQVEGVVTFIDGKTVYIQDETGAIAVYLTATAANTAVGDKVKACGALKNYCGLLELDAVDETNTEVYEILSNGNTVDAQAVTLADLAADTTNEYLSEKISVANVMITAVDSSKPSYTISDGTNSMLVYKTPKDADGNLLSAGTTINILEAIVSTYNAYQLRVADYSKYEIVSTCQHESTETQNAADATCTTDGYTGDVVCTVCGATVTAGEVITAPGHVYVDGACSVCGEAEPAPVDYTGVYYIYAKRSAEGSTYFYMSNDLGAASTKRYQAVDSTLTEAPAEMAEGANEDYAFFIAKNEDGTYTITSLNGKYLSWSSGNSGILTDEAMNVNIAAGDSEGTVKITFAVDADTTRNLALNSNSGNNYFAWYATAQINNLVLVPVTGEIHYHDWTESERVEATCTETGYATYACDCEKTYTETIAAMGHREVLYIDTDTHYASCCVCNEILGDPVEHTFVDGICECGATEVVEPEYEADPNLTFIMSISAGAEMQVRYTILNSKVSSFESFYLVVTKAVADGEPVVTTFEMDAMTPVTNTAGAVSAYQATYAGINAKEMGDEFATVLYAVASDGTIHYSATNTNSMKSYLVGKIDAASSIAELKTMCVDMLNYGAAAQIRLDYNAENLVNSDLTEEQKALGTQEIPEAVNNIATSTDGSKLISSVSLQSKVLLYLNSNYAGTDASTLKYVIKDAESGETLDTLDVTKAGTFWQAVYSNVGAKQMRQLLTIALYDGDTAVSQTLTWSIESYVASVREKTTSTEAEINMANAMLIYGDSVAAYMTASGQ